MTFDFRSLVEVRRWLVVGFVVVLVVWYDGGGGGLGVNCSNSTDPNLPTIVAYCTNGTYLGEIPRGSSNPSARWYIVGNSSAPIQLEMWQPFDQGIGGGLIGQALLVAIQDFVQQHSQELSFKMYNADWGGVVGDPICSNGYPCPDVILIGTTQVASRYAEGNLKDLSQFLSNYALSTGVVLNDDFVKYCFYDFFMGGAWYAVPFIADMRVVAFNRTTFDRVGLQYPPPYGDWALPWSKSWSWTTFADVLLKIKNAGISPAYSFKACWDEELKLGMIMAQNYGVRIVENGKCGLMTDGRFEKAMNEVFMRIFAIDKTGNTDFVDTTTSSFLSWVAQGKASDVKNEPKFCCNCGFSEIPGMAIDSPNTFVYFDLYEPTTRPNGTIGYALAPGQFSFLGGSGLVLTEKSNYPDLAWEFLLTLINTSNPQSALHQTAVISHSIPPYESALEQPRWNTPDVAVVKRQILKAVPLQYPLQTFPQFGQIENLKPLRHLWLSVLYKNFTLEYSIERACELIDWIFQPQCTSQDWSFNVSDCDSNSMRNVSYYWKQPRVCQGGVLPSSVLLNDCPYIVWNSPQALALTILTVVLMFCSMVMGVLLVRLRDSVIIRLGNVPLSLIVILGSLFLYSSVLASIGPNLPTCVIPTWFLCIGFVLMFGSFDLKMYRLWKIFNSNILDRVKITDNDLFQMLFLLVVLEIGLLLLWTFLPPESPLMSGQRDTVYDNFIVKEFYCQRGNTIPIVLLIVYNGIIFGGGCFFSFNLRSAPSDFKDKEFVTVSMSVVGFGAVVLLPAAFLLSSKWVNFVLVCLGILIVTTFTLSMYIVPKILHGLGILKIGEEMTNFINRKSAARCPICKKPMQQGQTTATSTTTPEKSMSQIPTLQ